MSLCRFYGLLRCEIFFGDLLSLRNMYSEKEQTIGERKIRGKGAVTIIISGFRQLIFRSVA